jgi:undecaprenyl-diphosphatase
MLRNGEAFFYRHGGKSVLFGRFVGPVRPVIPVVAGMLGMGPAHFAVLNVLSAIGWALVYILPGVFFGTSLAMAGRSAAGWPFSFLSWPPAYGGSFGGVAEWSSCLREKGPSGLAV